MSTNSINEIPPDRPKIKVIFKGFLITRIRHGESALIGALANSVCHRPIVHVYRIQENEDHEYVSTEITGMDIHVNQPFSLVVDPVSTGIEVFQMDDEDFNRLDDVENDKKDFRWFVDLNELHEIPIRITMDKLQPQFTLNQGLFHVSDLSDGEVRIERDGHPSKRFGRFGMEITARVDFDPTTTGAVLNNGSTRLLPRPDDLGYEHSYEVVFDCHCRTLHENESDFFLVYDKMVITDEHGCLIPNESRVQLEAPDTRAFTKTEFDTLRTRGQTPRGARCTPEVYCTGGNG